MGKESCEMQWLLNVFLKEHMPTGGMPKVEKLKIHKGKGCLGLGYWMFVGGDSCFQSITFWQNPIKIGSVVTFWSTMQLGGLDTLRYILFWRSSPEAWIDLSKPFILHHGLVAAAAHEYK